MDSAEALGLSPKGIGSKSIGFLGWQMITTSNGLRSVDLLIKLLYANSVIGRTRSQSVMWWPTRYRNRFPIYHLSLTVSLWMVSREKLKCRAHLPECPPKLTHEPNISIKDLERSCNLTTSLMNMRSKCEAFVVLLHGIKCVILENRSTTTKIKSCFLKVRGRPRMKLRCSQGVKGTCKGVYKPLPTLHYLTNSTVWHKPSDISLDTWPIKPIFH